MDDGTFGLCRLASLMVLMSAVANDTASSPKRRPARGGRAVGDLSLLALLLAIAALARVENQDELRGPGLCVTRTKKKVSKASKTNNELLKQSHTGHV